MRTPRINFIRDQLEVLKQHPLMKATEIVQNFRLHYTNTASFASSISRFKSELRKTGMVSDLEFLSQLKPNPEEMQKVNEKNRKHLIDKCKSSITLKNCGDNLIMYFRSCLESSELGPLIMGIQACSGLRMVEAVCRGYIECPKLTHSTDDVYWGWVTGVVKKQDAFPGHERPLLHRREIIQSAIKRLRTNHFSQLRENCTTFDNTFVSRKCCKKINRAIKKSWPYPEVSSVTSHFFRSFYVAATFHYFNKSSSLSQWCCDILAHESMDCSFPYTGLLVTGFGSVTFDADRQLQGLQRLKLN
jgi:hypothetical protein